MKAEEIMIGNWIRYVNNTYWIPEIIGKPVCVDIDIFKDVFFDNGGTVEPKYEPIPIDPEILEKAGFRKALPIEACKENDWEGNRWQYINESDIRNYQPYELNDFIVGRHVDGYAVYIIGANYDESTGLHPLVTVATVHQLQNLYFALTGSPLPLTLKTER